MAIILAVLAENAGKNGFMPKYLLWHFLALVIIVVRFSDKLHINEQ